MYRATHHLDSYILLTSKQKFPRLVGRYSSYLLPTQALSTFNLMSTEYRNQGDVSPCTACGHRMAYRKWKETKLHPGTAWPGNMLGCSLVSFHFRWAILCPEAVVFCDQSLVNEGFN